ncbi:MAG TPA: hypothetical protein VGI16_14755 [Candidatus Acidoferrum sp.]|jgi:hypothetical protein
MICRRILATALAFSLAGVPALARVAALGVITQANGANLSTAQASAGTTLYDGDHLSTSENGMLRVRGKGASLYLGPQSGITFRSAPAASGSDSAATAAELTQGTAIFSALQPESIEISADQASIRPSAATPTMAQVTIVGPKELRVYAQRGALEFSYKGETEIIPEGADYRVVLDPPEEAAKDHPSDQHIQQPAKRRKAFIFFLTGVFIAFEALLVQEALESPDRP